MDIHELITENIDIWTSAQQGKSTNGRGNKKKFNLYGIKKLRELILELAVRGKLVSQDENAEPASVLLERIASEKEQLIKEKKIKKPKKLPVITEEEKPFELPKGWEWRQLGNLCVLENGDRSKNYPNKSLLVDNGIPFVNAGHLQNGRINKDGMTFITEERFDLLRSGKFSNNDILYCLRGSLGKSAIVEGFENGAIASSLVIVRLYSNIDPHYFLNYFNSQLSSFMISKYDNGTAQPNLSATDLGKFLVPLPPKAEQQRIATKVDELMTLCDQLEQQTEESITAHKTLVETLLATLTNCKNSEELAQKWNIIRNHFETLFTTEDSIEQLKQTILQLAVMGKLVPQDPNDEPASVLLKKIAKEKEKLIKEGKIKKQKKLTPISDEEKPFDLPNGWEWCRLNTISLVGTGATPSRTRTDYYNPGEINWVTSGETKKAFISSTKEKISVKAVKETNVSVYPVGTLIVAMYGQGKTRGQITELQIEAGTNQACAAIQLFNKKAGHRKYIKLFFLKSYEELRSFASGGAQPNLNVNKISNQILPIPPFEEQCRIVAKVDELISICNKLEECLINSNLIQTQLAEMIIGQIGIK